MFPESEWPEDGSQPFVWAQGDATGYGHHADYLFGWKGDSLQRAMDARCDFTGCTELQTQAFSAGNTCTQEPIVNELIDGCKCPRLGGREDEAQVLTVTIQGWKLCLAT